MVRKVESSRVKSAAPDLGVADRQSVYLHSVYEKTWNPPAEQQKVDVCMCELAACVCVHMHSQEATALRLGGLLSDCISDSFRCDRLCLEPGLLRSLPAPLLLLGSEVGGERES